MSACACTDCSAASSGVCRGLSALTGFTGALLFPACNRSFGLYRTAQLSIAYQSALVSVAASSFFWSSDARLTVVVVIVAVVSAAL